MGPMLCCQSYSASPEPYFRAVCVTGPRKPPTGNDERKLCLLEHKKEGLIRSPLNPTPESQRTFCCCLYEVLLGDHFPALRQALSCFILESFRSFTADQ